MPNTEQALNQRPPDRYFWGLGKGLQQAMPMGWNVGVSVIHTAGWQEGGGKGRPGGGAHFLLSAPAHLCAEGKAQREQRGLVPMSKNRAASSGEVQRVRWCFRYRNQESMKKTRTWKARGQTGIYFCPTQ